MDNQTDLAKYKPNPSVVQTFEINEEQDDKSLSFDVFRKIILARKTEDFVFLALGKMMKVMRDRKLYKNLDFDTFSQFLESEEVNFSREKAYLYIRTYELYVEKLQMNSEELGKMGVTRLMMMAPVIKDMSREEAVQKVDEMKDLRYNTLVATAKSQTNRDGKPSVYYSEETSKWIINYFENTTYLVSLGKFEKGGEQNG